MSRQRFTRSLSVFLMIVLGKAAAVAGHKDDIGLTALQAELGAGAPTGAGISISQVELIYSGIGYPPDSSDSELSGKTVTLKSGASAASPHATCGA